LERCAPYWRRFIRENEVNEVYIVTSRKVSSKALHAYHGEVYGDPRDPMYKSVSVRCHFGVVVAPCATQ
jgi:hypothetical protein